jgi:hypothetical protein
LGVVKSGSNLPRCLDFGGKIARSIAKHFEKLGCEKESALRVAVFGVRPFRFGAMLDPLGLFLGPSGVGILINGTRAEGWRL